MQAFSKGDLGNEVVDIQLKLSTLGYNLGLNGADGCFGELTEAAVKAFQHRRGLTITGIVDKGTWKALVEATYKLGDRFLYLRSPFFRGDDVRELQTSLNTIGFNTGKVDGIYGETTERALREFQRNFGLTSDGIFGPTTLTAIRNLRHLLADKVSRIFPDPHRDQASAISIFQSKKIAIELDMREQADAGRDDPARGEINRELGMRLGNLLELLGAHVFYLGHNESATPTGFDQDIELSIGFMLNTATNSKSRGSTVVYCCSLGETEEHGQILAASAQEELIRCLGTQDLGVAPSEIDSRITGTAPAILIKPLFFTNSKEKAQLDQEVFRQKIAVAAFDGIKNYLQLL